MIALQRAVKMGKKLNASYNERLFSSGPRKMLHLARFRWLAKSINELQCPCETVSELGCFDGKVIDFLPIKPLLYWGFDANWEGGLDIAKQKWSDEPNYTFTYCCKPEDMDTNGRQFDIGICMETLEHIPPEMISGYLEKLQKATKHYIFITVPNEKGLLFLFKYLIKRTILEAKPYKFMELVNTTIGRTHRVERNQHKGFDYQVLIETLSNYFNVIHVTSIPLRQLPLSLSFTVGIIGKVRH